MAPEKTLEILKEMKADPKAKELFEGMETPKSPDEEISAYAQIAEKLGYAITAEDIKEAIEQEEARHKAKTDKVVSDMEALEDDDLEGVAGGFYQVIDLEPEECEMRSITRVYDQCAETYDDTQKCWINDACDTMHIGYYDCSGNYHADGAEFDCWFALYLRL